MGVTIYFILKSDSKRNNVSAKVYKSPEKPNLKTIRPIPSIVNQKVPQTNNTSQSFVIARQNRDFNFKVREKIGAYEVNFLDYYYPNRIGNFSQKQIDFRQFVFNFKDGKTPVETAKIVVSCILNNYENLIFANKGDVVFCPIPASTKVKNLLRFEHFCRVVCDDLNIINGFNFIEILSDRSPHKGDRSASRISNLKYNQSAFKGKTVFLFDDICTFGKSFNSNAGMIKEAGAKNIVGVFLGKTYYDG